MGALLTELDRRGIRTKVNRRRNGQKSGGIRFGVGSLAHLLKNRFYVGEVIYRGEGLFRHFDNRRQIASFAGLAPPPWQSGSLDREQGVSKAGNPRLRSTLIQLAWLWLRHQPQSVLALWFEERVRRNGGRLKKTTIVALARKLLVALWKYVTAGVVIEGAVMKAARR